MAFSPFKFLQEVRSETAKVTWPTRREQSKQRGLEELFEQVLVPTEKVTEVRRGRKVDAERKFFPGYVLVKMKLTDEAFHLIKNTPKVTGFLGAENKPMPISEAEAMR